MPFPFISKATRMIYSLWKRNADAYIFFLHLPKCGGQSLDYAMRRHFPSSKAHIFTAPSQYATKILYQLDDPQVKGFYYVYKFRENLLLYYMSHKRRFISGHVCFSELAYQHFHDTYKYVTILREPVKRWISHYFYDKYKTSNDRVRINEDVMSFIRSDRGKSFGHQFVKMLGGLDESGDYSSEQAINRAKDNLHKFEIVGCLEHLEEFLDQFEHCFGIKLKVPRKNLNPKSQADIQSTVTKEIEKEIIRLCQPDIELYHYVLNRIIKKN